LVAVDRFEQTSSVPNVVNTVIFDLGGVLSLSGRPVDLIRRFPDHDPDEVIRVMMGDYASDSDHPWHRLERGEISMDEYRSRIGELVAAAGLRMRTPTAEESNQRPGSTFEFVRSDAMHQLVLDLRAAGCRTGVLTNNIREFRDRWRELMDFDSLFDTVVDSHEVGLRKPDRAIYELTLGRLGSVAQESAFLDDVQSNVDAASRLGMHGVLVENDQSSAIETVRMLTGLR
jgi:epoxide hydrolase-like predicted phosphatase